MYEWIVPSHRIKISSQAGNDALAKAIEKDVIGDRLYLAMTISLI
jgi:hypothetical protein